MNLHKRFIVQFFIQLFLLSLFFLVLILTIWGIIGFTLSKDEIQSDLSKANASYFTNRITSDSEKQSIAKDLKELVENQGGWLILLDTEGEIVDSYNAPKALKTKFATGDFTDRLWGVSEKNEFFSYWEIELMDMDPLILLYGQRNLAEELLVAASPSVDWQQKRLSLSAEMKKRITKTDAWMQLISAEGQVLDEYGEVNKSSQYTIQELGELQDQNQFLSSVSNEDSNQTVIAGVKKIPTNAWETTFSNRNLIVGLLILLILLMLGTFWYARKFGLPLLVLMQWIQNLGEGRYEQPSQQRNGSSIVNKKGKVKRKYRLYKDLIATLEDLTITLKIHKQQQETLEKTREDWISGLSHDLKTPLSSISGYAQMLEAPEYVWSTQETRKFATIMKEKSSYMMELLEELTLTFRLKNHALPLVKEDTDINEFIRRIVIQFINDPSASNMKFNFEPASSSIRAQIDPKWFQRIIDNLIANAIKYNPSGTEIKISITAIEQHLFIVLIEDDGVGMETETLDKLFNRYYRGTNTEDVTSGTGLGLAITKQLVQLHNGSIHIDSVLEKGTIVRLIVPSK
ncbi:histidine kinase [Planococcus sp. PAMC 21323]|uniref:sensor histidine kinase n=1 Tax=Planococcus sp. PAMC 21323 TaxID=1526927 RepID=UPI00056FEC4E|nr:HAMP domain-containing sensor histidine kinase [Planococcus sp. PAMC 21323]AIY06770.1 histidine kinase [Planococcus sp. PAMC 21323]